MEGSGVTYGCMEGSGLHLRGALLNSSKETA